MNPQIWWYLSRASGIVAWLMLTASVLWGIILATDLFPTWRRPAWILSMHRWLAGLTIFFIVGHVGTILADSSVHFRVVDVLVPYASSWRPTAVAVGVVCVWAIFAVEVTALAAKRLSKKWWRDIHLAGYWIFWATCIHAALAGTDTSKPLYLATSLVALTAIIFATCYRVLTHHLPKRTPARGRGRRSLPSLDEEA
jgi:methionine sulfoxide reductase heme-binding subunit